MNYTRCRFPILIQKKTIVFKVPDSESCQLALAESLVNGLAAPSFCHSTRPKSPMNLRKSNQFAGSLLCHFKILGRLTVCKPAESLFADRRRKCVFARSKLLQVMMLFSRCFPAHMAAKASCFVRIGVRRPQVNNSDIGSQDFTFFTSPAFPRGPEFVSLLRSLNT